MVPDAVRSDLSDMQSSIEDHRALLDRGPELRESHFIKSQVGVDVPPVVVDYLRAVVREAVTMTAEECDAVREVKSAAQGHGWPVGPEVADQHSQFIRQHAGRDEGPPLAIYETPPVSEQ